MRHDAHVGVAHHFGGDISVTTLDVVVVFFEDNLYILKPTVQFEYLGRPAVGTSSFGVPNFKIDMIFLPQSYP